MFVENLKCTECGEEYSPDQIVYRCGCGGSLDVEYDYSQIGEKLDWQKLKSRNFDHHRYKEFYPVLKNDSYVSVGEGGTPLIKASSLGDKLGLEELYFKIEGMNPTGSFKDRGTCVEIGKALDFGKDQVVVASTGNMGASIAAYCARAGIEANIFIPRNVPEIKLKQMKSHGANIKRVDGDYSEAADKAFQAYEEKGWYLMGDYAYRGEGEKSVGFEIIDQIHADKIVLPVGNGTLLSGAWKGIKEVRRIGLADERPEMIGIQASGCSTVSKAFKEGLEKVPTVDKPDTVAGAIACGEPLDGRSALEAIRESGGFADDFPDSKLMEAKKMLAEKEGIYAEESCGTALAGIKENLDRLDPGETVVCVVTGHGLKT
ncbi:MAG: threonine synthase [Candidatus Nanohaloarchaea archaeon]|nr:threonine synthase [Candidatus Nanohaloarchaea archaeon]